MNEMDQNGGRGAVPEDRCMVCGAVVGVNYHRTKTVRGVRVRLCSIWCEARWEAEQEAAEDPPAEGRCTG